MANEVFAVFFSPEGNTRNVVLALTRGIAAEINNGDFFKIDITTHDARQGSYDFAEGDVVVVGSPTYAGRMPNKIMPYYKEEILGGGAFGIGVVTYGNRAYDDSLKELCTIMTDNSFNLLAGFAVPCEHAFASALATGHPDTEDLKELEEYGRKIGKAIKENSFKQLSLSQVPGRDMEESAYYVPLRADGEKAVFLKAKPVTDKEKCTECQACKKICPMDCYKDSVFEAVGICIKCQGCIKICGSKAKSFVDPDFLSHKDYLEREYSGKRETIKSCINF